MTKFLLIEHRSVMDTWSPAAVRRHFDHQRELDAELAAAGELVETQVLGARLGTGEDGGEALAGYRVVDVESEERALQIAALAAAAPGADGQPLGRPVEVRRLLRP
jgi:hypothetical protein